MLNIDQLRKSLSPQRVGRRVVHVLTVGSTNDEAWRLVETDGDETDGLVVLAEWQTRGRGRLGRKWQSPEGASVLCSVLLEGGANSIAGEQLGLIAAIAACEAIQSATNVKPHIKWPNDILVEERKLGGVLVESRSLRPSERAYVIGIGINCHQERGDFDPDLSASATSLRIENGSPVDRTAVVVGLLGAMDRWLAPSRDWNAASLHDAWMAAADPIGREIRLQQGGRVFAGSIIDVDPMAALIVRLDNGGIRAFNATDTTVLPAGAVDDSTPDGAG